MSDRGTDLEGLRLAAASLGLVLSELVLGRLAAYLVLLRKRVQHVADCLAVVAPLRRQLGSPIDPKTCPRLLDVGSGAGLPGLVLATVEAAWDVTCADAVGKKAAFIRQVAGELELPNLHAVHARVETLPGPPFDVIASRAFASLPEFVRLTRPLLAAHGVWMAMKGRRPDGELAALAADIEVFHVEPLKVPGLAAERCVVWMRPR
jgi:16S rRNA (guanine527-N7)-methyltransferase